VLTRTATSSESFMILCLHYSIIRNPFQPRIRIPGEYKYSWLQRSIEYLVCQLLHIRITNCGAVSVTDYNSISQTIKVLLFSHARYNNNMSRFLTKSAFPQLKTIVFSGCTENTPLRRFNSSKECNMLTSIRAQRDPSGTSCEYFLSFSLRSGCQRWKSQGWAYKR